jgi:ankyrin repeat protein
LYKIKTNIFQVNENNLFLASRSVRGNDEIVERLINAGIGINIKDNNGRTALHLGLNKIKL